MQPDSPPLSSPTASSISGNGDRPTRILIVDDDFMTRKVLNMQLEMNGYETQTAENGERAWESLKDWEPDIIISDWMMPELNGQEFCSRLKQDPQFEAVYFILLTAKDCQEDRVSGLDSGADEYLVKPCETSELLARVRAAERIVSLRRALFRKNGELETAMRRINRELEYTSAIQRNLLPQVLPNIQGYAFAARYEPSSECSGDYYDLFELEGGRFGLIMADVSGHGTPAMVAMAVARTVFHHLVPQTASAADLLTRANRMLYAHLPTSQYMTAFYAICDIGTGRVQYSSAGQNPPLLLKGRESSATYLPDCEGFPLKLVTPEAAYDDFEVQVEPGDTLVLYTDGIPEARDTETRMFGNSRLKQAALDHKEDSCEKLVGGIMDQLSRFVGSAPIEDDISLLAVRRN